MDLYISFLSPRSKIGEASVRRNLTKERLAANDKDDDDDDNDDNDDDDDDDDDDDNDSDDDNDDDGGGGGGDSAHQHGRQVHCRQPCVCLCVSLGSCRWVHTSSSIPSTVRIFKGTIPGLSPSERHCSNRHTAPTR